jgi:hypothetical protein
VVDSIERAALGEVLSWNVCRLKYHRRRVGASELDGTNKVCKTHAMSCIAGGNAVMHSGYQRLLRVVFDVRVLYPTPLFPICNFKPGRVNVLVLFQRIADASNKMYPVSPRITRPFVAAI